MRASLMDCLLVPSLLFSKCLRVNSCLMEEVTILRQPLFSSSYKHVITTQEKVRQV